MRLLDQSAFILALTSFALGSSVLARNAKNKLYWSYFLLTFTIFVWSICFFASRLPSLLHLSVTFYDLHLAAHVWMTPVGLFFIRSLLRREVSAQLLSLTVVGAGLLSGFLIVDLDVYPVVRSAIFFSPIILTAQLVWMMSSSKEPRLSGSRMNLSTNTHEQLAVRSVWIYVGALVVMLTTTMDHVPQWGNGIPVIGNILLTIYLFFLSQAVTYQKLLNFRALAFRFFVLLFVALIVTVVYAALFAWIMDNPVLFFANSFFVSVMILLILDPLRSWVRFLTHRFITHEHRKIDKRLSEGVQSIFSSFDETQLSLSLKKTIEDVIESDRVQVYLIHSDGIRFRNVLQSLQSEIEITHAFFGFALRHRRPGEVAFILDQDLKNEIDRSAGRSVRSRLQPVLDELQHLGANLFIPIFSKENPLGFLLISAHRPPQKWGADWGVIGLLHPLLEAASQRILSLESISEIREKDRLATLGHMAAGLAHEIRNPLSAIKGAAQYLQAEATTEDRSFLDIIESETNRLNAVVSQFLEFSKPSSQAYERTDLVRLAMQTLETFKLTPKASEISLKFTSDFEELEVDLVPHQIQQVLGNFIQNAIESFDESQAYKEVLVELRRASSRDDLIEISVKDNGSGIAPELKSKLFTPFFTTKSLGTGLGLSICKRIANEHQGRLIVNSEQGRGSEFVLQIPSSVHAKQESSRDEVPLG